MVTRRQWIPLVEKAWLERPVVWLAGVRRVGKTCLSQSLGRVEYFDCELPRVRGMMEDPEGFLEDRRGKRIVLDEIHRLPNPSEILKIAADHFPDIRVVATGSSTLAATARFRDTLTGRKRDLRLTPMTLADLADFDGRDWKRRFLHGGLPSFFLADRVPERDFQEWMDAYWAKDIQELFRLERRSSFLKFVELVLVQSGGIFEAARFAGPCEVSRTTIMNYLGALEATFVAHVIRPFNTHRHSEIVAAPKVFGFDTGFMCHYRGWQQLRPDDFGTLWEHIVLNEMQALLQGGPINYWRDKRDHEVDFILARRGAPPLAIECKWSVKDLDPAALKAFRHHYPDGDNIVVAHDVDRAFTRTYADMKVRFESLSGLKRMLEDVCRQGSQSRVEI
jgi:predicted AAA+ superfamily ATPase